MQATIRNGDPESDIAFIMSSWLKTLRHGHMLRYVGNDLYYQHMHALLTRTLQNARVRVACDTETGKSIYSFIVFDDEAVYFAYTKDRWRGHGLFRTLLDECSQDTKYFASLGSMTWVHEYLHNRRNWQYNPFHLLQKDRHENTAPSTPRAEQRDTDETD